MLTGTFLQFIGVASAGFVNLLCARNTDVRTGIYAWEDPDDPSTVIPAKSIKLGRRAFLQCACSRVALPVPVFLFPGLIRSALIKCNKWPKAKNGQIGLDLCKIVVMINCNVLKSCLCGCFRDLFTNVNSYFPLMVSNIRR